MKTILTRSALALSVATILGLVGTSRSFADDSRPASKENEDVYKGTITAIDRLDKTVSVKGFLFSKTFNTAEPCKVSLEDQPVASLSDLHPGQKVDVHYQDVQGVLVAGQIVQHDQMLTGYIAAIDPGKRTFVVKGSGGKQDFTAPENCSVVLKDDKVGTLENLKVGHHVNVAYEPADGAWTAHKIEQKAEKFVGTIQAIDGETRTVKAKSFLAQKKFNLADSCRIVVPDKPDARLRDLRIGDRVEFSYEEADGVLVANRVGRDAHASETEGTETAKINNQ